MKAGDLVKFHAPSSASVGVIIAESPHDRLLADAFVVLWSTGEISERISASILEVINESR